MYKRYINSIIIIIIISIIINGCKYMKYTEKTIQHLVK